MENTYHFTVHSIVHCCSCILESPFLSTLLSLYLILMYLLFIFWKILLLRAAVVKILLWWVSSEKAGSTAWGKLLLLKVWEAYKYRRALLHLAKICLHTFQSSICRPWHEQMGFLYFLTVILHLAADCTLNAEILAAVFCSKGVLRVSYCSTCYF